MKSAKPTADLVAIVTGATSGIGRALALRLGRSGYRVGLIARRANELTAAALATAGKGGTAVAAVADVGDSNGAPRGGRRDRAASRARDIMVANAGYGVPTRLDPLNTAEVEQTFRVNVMGVIYSIEAVLPGMLARGERAPGGDLQPGGLQGPAGRVGLLRQQGGGERLHGGPADRVADRGAWW